MRFCNESNDKKICDRFNIQVTANKEFEAKFFLSKRQAPNQYGHMLPYCKFRQDLLV